MLDHHVLEIGLVGEPVCRVAYPAVDIERLELEAFAASARNADAWTGTQVA